jgi:hypothetical protein
MAPGFMTLSSSANTANFTSMRSNTASMTMSAEPMALYFSTGSSSPRRAARSSWDILPFFTCAS